MSVVANIMALLVMPILITGTINRVKARWAGRVGPPLFQLAFDIWRLVRKTPVYSNITTPVFRLGAAVVLVTAIALDPPEDVMTPFQSFYLIRWRDNRLADNLGTLLGLPHVASLIVPLSVTMAAATAIVMQRERERERWW